MCSWATPAWSHFRTLMKAFQVLNDWKVSVAFPRNGCVCVWAEYRIGYTSSPCTLSSRESTQGPRFPPTTTTPSSLSTQASWEWLSLLATLFLSQFLTFASLSTQEALLNFPHLPWCHISFGSCLHQLCLECLLCTRHCEMNKEEPYHTPHVESQTCLWGWKKGRS